MKYLQDMQGYISSVILFVVRMEDNGFLVKWIWNTSKAHRLPAGS